MRRLAEAVCMVDDATEASDVPVCERGERGPRTLEPLRIAALSLRRTARQGVDGVVDD
jgi:hypothetical protein